MSEISLRRLLSRLTAIALSTTAVGPAAAEADGREPTEPGGEDGDVVLAEGRIDPETIDPPDAAAALGRGLALAADRMRPLSATQIVSTWALSSDPLRRLAVAHALEWSFPLVGDAIVIDHLSRDPEPSVRVAAARAAWARRVTGGDAGVLDRLRDDPDPGVRAVADKAGEPE